MKFLYLKGIDVLGPVEAAELVKETWFSDEVLVCPEDKAEQESAWKSAKDYPEFKTSLEQEIFPQENQQNVQKPLPPAPPAVSVQAAPSAPIETEKETSVPAAPAAPKNESETSKLRELPPLEDTKSES